jgi:phosphoethanolamine N-methyltransferase
MVTMLEFILGDGYMSPGGAQNVANLLEGTSPAGKRILDIGCGIGGPAFEMARSHGASVTGIDLEEPLIARAREAARKHGLESKCQFQTVEAGALPFDSESFDIVISSGAITQTPEKADLYADIYRVLSPGGYLSCYEWMGCDREPSEDMRYWIELEGLSYTLETLQQYTARFEAAGFRNVVPKDASEWYRHEARREYELIKGEMYEQLIELIGQEDSDHFVEDWRMLAVVCDNGELLQGYCRGEK